jgi:serine/threonine protein kinase
MGQMSQGQNTNNDSSYGQTAVSLGYVTEAQVQECAQIQTRMRDMGIDEPLGELMSKKGYLTPQYHSNILKKLGVHVSPIPGYTILGKIGQGGMGAVYKAMQTSVNRTVAIKIMSSTAVKDKTYVSRFFQEAQAAAALNHKNLIAAIDVGAAGGLYYFVMEFVTGKSCREITNTKGSFDQEKAIDVAMQMAEVLQHIHEHSMVHRDIKPENILVTPEGQVKLCDLGLAKSTGPAEQSLTQDGLAVGTPYFMSPEQVRGDKDVDIRADLYSLGATLYFLVTGKHPFEGKSAAETMSLHLNAPVPDPRKLVPTLHEDFAWVMHKLMAKDRKDRYQQPVDLLEDLKKILSGSSPQHARQHAAKVHLHKKAEAAARLSARKAAARWPVFVAGGAVVVAAAVVLFVVMGTSAPEPAKPAAPPPKPETVFVKVSDTTPKDDPKRAADAGRLYSASSELYKKQQWGEAKAELEKLRKDFQDLQYTRELSKTIGEMIGVCDVRLRELTSAQAKEIDEARTAMRDGRFREAHDRFQLIAKAGGTGLQPDIDLCRTEMEAEALLADARALRDSDKWLESQIKLTELGKKYAGTVTVGKHTNEIVAIGLAVLSELKSGTQLAFARTAGAASHWADLTKALAELEGVKETKTFRANETEIRDLAAKRDLAMAKQGEDLAKQKYVEATNQYDKAVGEKKFDDAQQAMRSYSQVYAPTKFYETKKAEIDTKIADAARKKTADRDAEARKLYQQLPKDLKAGNYEAAMEAITKLLGDYADTGTVKSNEAQIRKDKARCEQSIGVPENILVIMEFEDYPGTWRILNGATAGNTDEPYQGKRAAHLNLPNSNSRAFHPIAGVTGRAESISFWARSVRKGPVTLVDFFISDDMNTFHVPNIQLSTDWKLCSYRFTEFKPFNNQAIQNKSTINLNRIHEFAFGPTTEGGGAGNGVGYEIIVDSLRVEGKK